MTKSMHKTLPGSVGRVLSYLQWFVQAILSILLADIILVDGQIHVCNLKGLAKRNLLCQARAKHAVMRFLDILIEDV